MIWVYIIEEDFNLLFVSDSAKHLTSLLLKYRQERELEQD